jgi:hypothetical protein
MSSYMPKGYGIGPSGRMMPLQPPTASNPQAAQPPAGHGGDGFGGITPLPKPAGGMPPAGGGVGAGGGSVDTGGLPAGPPDGGGGFGGGQPFTYSPTFGGDTTNVDRSRHYDNSSFSYHGGNRSTVNDRSRTTNIDNSQTTMGQGQRVQRQKTKAQLNPFQSINPEMDQKMIGDPSNPMTQLRIMRGS